MKAESKILYTDHNYIQVFTGNLKIVEKVLITWKVIIIMVFNAGLRWARQSANNFIQMIS